MSYLHCHTKGCGWGQDDFWSFKLTSAGFKIIPFLQMGYNPISFFFSLLWCGKYSLLIPKRVIYDKTVINDYGWKTNNPHN